MSTANPIFAALRQRLAEKFPQAMRAIGGAAGSDLWRTGLSALDEAVGGLPRGALTEVVCAAPSCGGQLLLGALLQAAGEQRGRVAWIDAHDSFDPQSWPQELLAALVWVRCRAANEAMQVTDILARDANLALVLLDLRDASDGELRRIPAPFWYRLQRAVETSEHALVVTTPRAAVPSARLRLVLEQAQGLAALSAPRHEISNTLAPAVQRQRANPMISAAG